MTPTQLRSIIQAATPGPWNNDIADWQVHDNDPDQEEPLARCDCSADADAIVALRNHAEVLLDVVEAAKAMHRWAGTTNAGCGEAHRDYARFTAALARMEEPK